MLQGEAVAGKEDLREERKHYSSCGHKMDKEEKFAPEGVACWDSLLQESTKVKCLRKQTVEGLPSCLVWFQACERQELGMELRMLQE